MLLGEYKGSEGWNGQGKVDFYLLTNRLSVGDLPGVALLPAVACLSGEVKAAD